MKDRELLFFTSKNCLACKQLLPRIKELSLLKIDIVNVEERANIATEYGVTSLPTVILLEEGKPMDMIVGSVSDSTLKSFLGV